MKFKNTLEIVTKDIQDIEKLVSNFNNYSSIPNIELDLALSKLRNVYDVLLLFRETADTAKPASESAEPAPPVKAEKIPEKELPVPEIEIPPAVLTRKEPETIQAIGTIESPEADIFDVEKTPPQEKKPSQSKKPITKSSGIVAEKFTSDETYINELLGEQTLKSDISARHQSSPIKTIAGSIGINDKFFFIRELFNNDPELFRRTLDELDNSANFNSAYTILLNNFNWDMKSDPVQLLLNLVRRKFISPGNE